MAQARTCNFVDLMAYKLSYRIYLKSQRHIGIKGDNSGAQITTKHVVL